MASLSYFPLYPKDFLGATGRLNAEKFGIYTRLLFTSWFEPLDNDIADLAFIAGSNEKLTKQVLERYFTLEDGAWVNHRLEKERKKATDKHRKAVESGRKGAEKRWGDDSNPNGDPNSPPNGNPNSPPNGNPNSRDDSKWHSKTIATQNSEPITHNTETQNEELKDILSFFPPSFFHDMTVPNILLKVKHDYGQDALRAMCEKVAVIKDPKKLNGAYVRSIVKNTDLEGIAKGTSNEQGEKLEWLARVQCVEMASKNKNGKTTDDLYRALKDENGNNIKFEKGHRYEGQSVWVKK